MQDGSPDFGVYQVYARSVSPLLEKDAIGTPEVPVPVVRRGGEAMLPHDLVAETETETDTDRYRDVDRDRDRERERECGGCVVWDVGDGGGQCVSGGKGCGWPGVYGDGVSGRVEEADEIIVCGVKRMSGRT